jgi:hypothetical protein
MKQIKSLVFAYTKFSGLVPTSIYWRQSGIFWIYLCTSKFSSQANKMSCLDYRMVRAGKEQLMCRNSQQQTNCCGHFLYQIFIEIGCKM